MTEQNRELRADPGFKQVTNRLAQEVGLKVVGAELPQSLTADLVLEIPAGIEARLETSLFSFLKGYQYAIVEFKGQNDQFTLHKFLNNLARTALFCLRRDDVPVDKVLNLYVCSAYPDGILGLANQEPSKPLFENSSEEVWLWRARLFFQEIAIVVCRDLPIEPRFYDWLMFAPARTAKWREFARTAVREGRRDLVDMLIRLRPKEFGEMSLDVQEILNELDPEERERLSYEWASIFTNAFLPKLAIEEPEKLEIALTNLADNISAEELSKIITFLNKQAQKKKEQNGDNFQQQQ